MSAKQTQAVIEQLTQGLPYMSKSLKKAAMYVIDHPAEFGIHAIRDTAELAGVSTNTLVRLAQQLGYETYDQLRSPFKQALTHRATEGDNSRWIAELYERGGAETLRASSLANALDNVALAIRNTECEKMEAVVDRLLNARNIYLIGMRAPYALAHYFYYLGRMALPNLILAPRHANTPADELLHAGEKDVVFAISSKPFTRETIQACHMAKQRRAQLILLSDSTAESLSLQADITLVAPVNTAHFFHSLLGFLVLIDWLLARVVEKGGTSVQDRIALMKSLREQSDAYWQTQTHTP